MRRLPWFALVTCLALLNGPVPVAAQQSDPNTILKRFREYYAAGNYNSALIEGERLEALTKTRFGTSHPNYAKALTTIAMTYQAQARYADAEKVYRYVRSIQEKALGAEDLDVAQTLNNLANTYEALGRYGEAEATHGQALTIREKVKGPNDPSVAQSLLNLAAAYHARGKYQLSEAAVERALAINEKALGPNHPEVAKNLTGLAVVYREQGKYSQAERLLQRALEIQEKTLNRNSPDVAVTLINLAAIYQDQDKYDQAEALYRRALAINEERLGTNHPNVATILSGLALASMEQGKFADAETTAKRALGIREAKFGTDHAEVAHSLTDLGNLYQRQRRLAEAETVHKRALAIHERTLDANPRDVAKAAGNLGNIYLLQQKFPEAEELYKRTLANLEQSLGPNHPDVALAIDNLAILYGAMGNSAEALAYSRKSSTAVIAHASLPRSGTEQRTSAGGLVEQRADYFTRHVSNLSAAMQAGLESGAALSREALEIAQWASQSSAAAALNQTASRFAGSDALGTMVRESQDLLSAWREQNLRLFDAVSKTAGSQNANAIADLRGAIAEIEKKLNAIDTRIEREFPDYSALANPKPVKAKEVQALLGTDEALIFLLTSARETFVFALTRDGLAWQAIPIGAEELSAKVVAFRRGLNAEAPNQIESGGKPELFDLGTAYDLYTALLGPVEGLIKEKQHLILVPSGPLTAVPFQLLVTQKPSITIPEVKSTNDFAAYRDVPWLLKRQAVSVLPSVASLKALRSLARAGRAQKPMIGFGDPVFNANEPASAKQRSAARKTRAYTDFWQGAGVDRALLSQALPRLEDTADELKAVAQKLDAPATDIYLRGAASETAVKRANLSDYRVVYFATHGLVAGDIKGLAEPSLALSIPAKPTSDDDGLLTASEVAQLKLNADWVVLSACNTIAGDKPGAEALSGLARAFFYAGARAMLVTHWAVDSNAATLLTTGTFENIRKDPKIGRAEALRRAMLDYMNDASNPRNAYPGYWAPFVVVGEGAAR